MYNGRVNTVLLVHNAQDDDYKCATITKKIEDAGLAGMILYKKGNKTCLMCSQVVSPSLNPVLGGFSKIFGIDGVSLFESDIVLLDEMKRRLGGIGFSPNLSKIESIAHIYNNQAV